MTSRSCALRPELSFGQHVHVPWGMLGIHILVEVGGGLPVKPLLQSHILQAEMQLLKELPEPNAGRCNDHLTHRHLQRSCSSSRGQHEK